MDQVNEKKQTYKSINIIEMTVFVMLVLAALTGVVNVLVLSLGIAICFGVLLFYDKLYLAFPFVVFYNGMYGIALGVSVLRLFTFFVICNVVFRLKEKKVVNSNNVVPLVLFVLYIIGVMFPSIGVSSSLFILMDILCCFIIVSEISRDVNALKNFFKVYSLICIISYFSGMLADNYIHIEYEFSRFNGTFEDPNYMGFFFTIGIWALICLKLYDKRIRYGLIVVMYAMMMLTLSITAIAVNIVMVTVYLIITKKIKLNSVGLVLLSVILVLSLYNYGLQHPNTTVGAFAERIENSINNFVSGDVGGATTGRTELALEHWNYFWSLPLVNILFGGIPSNSRFIHYDLRAAAHNEYVDMLLNLGVVGSIIMLGYFIYTFVNHWKKYKDNPNEESMFYVIGKSVWALYAMTLTVFLDYRFLFMFLI